PNGPVVGYSISSSTTLSPALAFFASASRTITGSRSSRPSGKTSHCPPCRRRSPVNCHRLRLITATISPTYGPRPPAPTPPLPHRRQRHQPALGDVDHPLIRQLLHCLAELRRIFDLQVLRQLIQPARRVRLVPEVVQEPATVLQRHRSDSPDPVFRVRIGDGS